MYEFTEEVTFHPWVGLNYGRESRFGVRLLVLGESHYNDAKNKRHQESDWKTTKDSSGGDHIFTQFVVRMWAQDKKNAFFTKTANVLLGHGKANRDNVNSELWEHVAFYNYVNNYAPWHQGNKPKCPTLEQWQKSKTSFDTVLQRLKPDAVLMLGKDLSKWVADQHEHTNIEWKQYQPYQHGNINFLGIDTPHGRLSYDKAIPAFKELLANTKQRIAQM